MLKRKESHYAKIRGCSGIVKHASIVEHNGNLLKPHQCFLNIKSYDVANVPKPSLTYFFLSTSSNKGPSSIRYAKANSNKASM